MQCKYEICNACINFANRDVWYQTDSITVSMYSPPQKFLKQRVDLISFPCDVCYFISFILLYLMLCHFMLYNILCLNLFWNNPAHGGLFSFAFKVSYLCVSVCLCVRNFFKQITCTVLFKRSEEYKEKKKHNNDNIKLKFQ